MKKYIAILLIIFINTTYTKKKESYCGTCKGQESRLRESIEKKKKLIAFYEKDLEELINKCLSINMGIKSTWTQEAETLLLRNKL